MATPPTSRSHDASPAEVTQHSSMRPTRKWWAALVTALAAVAVNWIDAGEFNKTIAIALVGVIAQAVVAYLVPNQSTPGGASLKRNVKG